MTGDFARQYRARGWRVLPLPAGEKGARCRGWQDLDLDLAQIPQRFANACNVGVILGSRSGELVDIDLEGDKALALAAVHLPATGAIFGHPSKPQSHWLHVAPGARYENFGDLLGDGKNTLVELRADGRDGGGAHQTIFPPSIADSERREWHGDTIAPAVIDPRALRAAVAWLAIGCLVARHVSRPAAERPGPDLPRLVWENDHALGRTAYRRAGWAASDELRAQRRDIPRADARTGEGRLLRDVRKTLLEHINPAPNGSDAHCATCRQAGSRRVHGPHAVNRHAC